jgi:hypothetical protein
MSFTRGRRSKLMSVLVAAVILGTFGGYVSWAKNIKRAKELSLNYLVSYPGPPKGWESVPHSPRALFLYQRKGSNIMINAGLNQLEDDINPTPDLGTENLANQVIDMTRDNMPGWTAEKLDSVEAGGTSFRLVKRVNADHIVINAFTVKGNTTLLISLTGRGVTSSKNIEKSLDDFRHLLSSVNLTLSN